jgi:hypothetical protein
MTAAVGRQCKSDPSRTYDEQAKIARCHPQEQFAVHAPRPVVPIWLDENRRWIVCSQRIIRGMVTLQRKISVEERPKRMT